MVRSADSVGANISEGFGRFHYKDRLKFIYYSRGSLYETKTWLKKSKNRQLIEEELSNSLLKELDILGVKVNNYINVLRKNINKEQTNYNK
ncbi:four helix bundle protein [Tenacibaculum todarodis]|uniref:four helix bundle protein n=1 Tax=Tenacibaculum todarodis TaxID=1850252 RepID=UPI00194E5756|nr:four helix bundle protein [Tenacibaculum todarodis]